MKTKLNPVFRLSDYDYPLEKSSIAQFPLKRRDQARLMVLYRSTSPSAQGSATKIEHRIFSDIVQYLKPGDLLVLNNTRVIPARLLAKKAKTGGGVKVLLLRPDRSDTKPLRWEAMIQGSVAYGQRLLSGEGLEITVLERSQDGRWRVELECDGDLFDVLERIGKPPLPPYIRRPALPSDHIDYQTIYARNPGSIAAPTAGLHFTRDLLKKARAQDVQQAFITLHIGYGTFRPVRSSDIRRHRLYPEYYQIPPETRRLIEETQARKGRIIAVGTSTTRALEAAVLNQPFRPSGATDLFIYPGYRFQVVRGLLTNFHMPKSTLFMLASAFSGIKVLKEAYDEALRLQYRFLSYGDAMLIL